MGEVAAFTSFCSTASSTYCSKLPGVLADLRRLPANPDWMVGLVMEVVRVFAPNDVASSAYGETPFESWLDIVRRPSLARLFPHVSCTGDAKQPQAHVTIL